jgi:hypothetical protein
MVEPSDRLRVYVAGPITQGDPYENIHRAIRVGRRMLKDGLAPYVPHLDVFMFMGINGASEIARADLLDWDYAWIEVADALYRLAGLSEGSDLEVELALKLDIPVYYEHYTDDYDDLLAFARKTYQDEIDYPPYVPFRGDARA